MSEQLQQVVLRYTGEQDHTGVTTPVRGLHLIRRTTPSELEHTVEQPLVCLVLQGRKRVTVGRTTSSYGTGDTMIVTGNVPMVSRISQASIASPYLALALALDTAVITDLVISAPRASQSVPACDTGDDLRDALGRLVRLLDRPDSLAILKDGLIREIHHWLLLGRQGHAIRELGLPDSHARRIARAVAILRADHAKPVTIERLAAAASMSRSAFHLHFRAITSMSPLQFQKQLRLMEARRLILSKGRSLSQVAFDVGYESASQFSREYARMYGQPPIRDKQAVSERWRTPGDGQ
nr:AraC family transcriptional regulator [uncultured Roseateles sp.]